MAAFELEFSDDFLKDLLETDFQDIAEEALTTSVPILERSVKDSIKGVVSHDGDSELVNSIHSTKPRKTKTDAWIINVTPKGVSNTKTYHHSTTGRGNYPVSNALKAIWLEYGIAGHQAPKPFLTKACNDAENAVEAKIQEVYNRKTGST